MNKPLTAAIGAIGDELLIGQVIDSNSSYIARTLNNIGIQVNQKFTLGDQASSIKEGVDSALAKADVLILTGGLGPTKDDITKSILASYTGSRAWVHSPAQEKHIAAICEKRGGAAMLALNQSQADVPDTCEVLENHLGTAPGMWFNHKGKILVSLPGVPYEMEGLMPQVSEKLRGHFAGRLHPILHKTLSTFGIPESVLSARIAAWEDALPKDLHLAYLPNPLAGVRLRLSCYQPLPETESKIDQAFIELKSLLGDAIYGQGTDSLDSILGDLLLQRQATVATAESCTAGRIAALLSSRSGASRYFMGSVVAYDNRVKQEVLGVPEALLETHGAVSAACVEAMAKGVQKLLGSDYAIATSGIAGPSGGSPEKPVGTLWVAVAGPQKCSSHPFLFFGDRLRNTERFTATALNQLRLSIINAII